jgi:hypothetical protein
MNRSTWRIQVTLSYPPVTSPYPPSRPKHPRTSQKKARTMPRVRLSPLVEEIHGTLYDVVFKKSPKGNLIVTRRPDMSGVKWSKAQKNQRQRMAKE